MAFERSHGAAKVGVILSRVVVPGWVLAGAVFKLVEASPRTLPRETILNVADSLGLDLYVLLATLIAIELVAVALMLTLAWLARPVAIFMLSVFCLVLIGEMMQGNVTSCGCLGAYSPPPWIMLAIDGTLLLGVLVFDPATLALAAPTRTPAVMAVLLSLVGIVTSYGIVIPAGRPLDAEPPPAGAEGGTSVQPAAPTDPTVNPTPAAVPGYWFAADVESWVGKPWRKIELFFHMKRWPRDLDRGKRYVTFYSRTCDHCEEMFYADLVDPALGSMVTAVEVPDSKTRLTSPDAWPLPETECELLALPLGCDWILTSPLTLTIEDGTVTCATEGDHRECMGLSD